MEVLVSPMETSVGVGTVEGEGPDGRPGMGSSSPGGAVDPGRIQEVVYTLRYTRDKHIHLDEVGTDG